MCLCVAGVKLCLAQCGVVQEKAAREIVYGIFGLGQELVGEKAHMVSSLTKYSWEERVVTPFTFLSHYMCGEHVLEDKAREVPAAHHVGEFGEQSAALTSHLAWCGLEIVAVLVAVRLAIALSDDKNDGGRTLCASVYRYLLISGDAPSYLLVGQ